MTKIEQIKLSIPVYYVKKFKTKEDKLFLVSLNWYRNAFYYEQNEVKKYFQELIKEQLKDVIPLLGKYKVAYNYYYKTSSSDLANVTPMCSKWVNDVLQEQNIVPNDNVNYLVEETHKVATQDKTNPRCEIIITPIDKNEEL